MSLSSTLLRVTLPSTNEAVYEVQPQHLNDTPGTTLAQRAMRYGRHVAVRIDTTWYEKVNGTLRPIRDPETCFRLQNLPEA